MTDKEQGPQGKKAHAMYMWCRAWIGVLLESSNAIIFAQAKCGTDKQYKAGQNEVETQHWRYGCFSEDMKASGNNQDRHRRERKDDCLENRFPVWDWCRQFIIRPIFGSRPSRQRPSTNLSYVIYAIFCMPSNLGRLNIIKVAQSDLCNNPASKVCLLR